MHFETRAAALFAELRSSAAHPVVVDWLERTAADGTDFDGYKMNPFRIAELTGIPRLDATRAFLFASRLGLTDLTWDVHCPSCLALPAYHKHLMEIPERAHCTLCSFRWDLSIEDQLEATFTWNPDVRRIDPAKFVEHAYPRDRPALFQRLGRDQRYPTMAMSISSGTTASKTATLAEGDYDYSVPGDDQGLGRIVVTGAATTEEQTVRLQVSAEGRLDVLALSLQPGPVRFEVTTHLGKKDGGMHVQPALPPKNWVSATYLTSLQDFRDLFSGEFLAPDRSFGIRSITLLFTDITGSTELYERLGDARAYTLVQQHFELMTAVIRRREGGIVKTIGDAVMAAFPVNADALKAALEIQEGFAKVSEPLRQITVKIGLHRGPTIAVTSNRLMDYFGRTVNVAARVQGASEPGEVLVTDAVLADPDAARWLLEQGGETTRRVVQMKGIAGPVPVLSVRAARAAASTLG